MAPGPRKGVIQRFSPVAQPVCANEAILKTISIPLRIVRQSCDHRGGCQLEDELAKVEHVVKVRDVRVLFGKLDPLLHPHYWHHGLASCYGGHRAGLLLPLRTRQLSPDHMVERRPVSGAEVA